VNIQKQFDLTQSFRVEVKQLAGFERVSGSRHGVQQVDPVEMRDRSEILGRGREQLVGQRKADEVAVGLQIFVGEQVAQEPAFAVCIPRNRSRRCDLRVEKGATCLEDAVDALQMIAIQEHVPRFARKMNARMIGDEPSRHEAPPVGIARRTRIREHVERRLSPWREAMPQEELLLPVIHATATHPDDLTSSVDALDDTADERPRQRDDGRRQLLLDSRRAIGSLQSLLLFRSSV
jgi:hypothetical protein